MSVREEHPGTYHGTVGGRDERKNIGARSVTPLAQKVARDLTLPIKARTVDDRDGEVLPLFKQEMHCFEVSAIFGPVNTAMDADNLWPDIEELLPRIFLPAEVTWLEQVFPGGSRVALVLRRAGDGYHLASVHDGVTPFSMRLCDFRARGPLEGGERIAIEPAMHDGRAKLIADLKEPQRLSGGEIKTDTLLKAAKEAGDLGRVHSMIGLLKGQLNDAEASLAVTQSKLAVLETDRTLRRFVGMAVLMLDLINTPGLVGLRQHDPHRALAKHLGRIGIGRYPLRGWSEVVVKTATRIAGEVEHRTGPAYHKCLHFVRSHRRRYRTGRETIIPPHWRGDPALGIKRTRYRVEPA